MEHAKTASPAADTGADSKDARPHATEEDRGKQFLELIDKQSTLQQAIAQKLTRLIDEHKWESDSLRQELADLAREHSDISRQINGLE